ncbi:MAG: Hydroxylamine oxidase, partial [Actinobacteria bacterium]|nr:Hydroxylamine oxidase [Actinomycetota bacterium]
MKKILPLVIPMLFLSAAAPGASAPLSEKTQECISCHREVTPGIVADWERSLHSRA